MIKNNFIMVSLFALLPAYIAARCGFAALQSKLRALWGTALVIATWVAIELLRIVTTIGMTSDAGVFLAHSLLFDFTGLLWLSVCFAMQIHALVAPRGR
jgi:hypothetical protein